MIIISGINQKCRIIFATTEIPQKALLKTFLRRIPVILTIPSLAQRGENEKLELMYNFLKNEREAYTNKNNYFISI